MLRKREALVGRHLRAVLAQQFHRALDGGQRGLELVRDVGGEVADVLRALLQRAGHGGHGLRQLGDLLRAGVRQRRYRPGLASGGAVGLVHQLAHRPADGQRAEQRQCQHQAQQRQAGEGQRLHLALDGLAQVGRRAHQHHGTEHAAFAQDRLGDVDAQARAAADGIQRRCGLGVAAPRAHRADRGAAQRAAHFLVVHQRQAEVAFVAVAGGGHHHAAVVHHGDTGQRGALGLLQDRVQFLPDAPGQRIGVVRAGFRRRRSGQHAVLGQVQHRGARAPVLVGVPVLGRGHQHVAVVLQRAVGGDGVAAVGRGETLGGGAVAGGDEGGLCDQLRLGLADQRALVEAQPDDAAQRQRQDHQVGEQQDATQAEPEQVFQLHGPSL